MAGTWIDDTWTRIVVGMSVALPVFAAVLPGLALAAADAPVQDAPVVSLDSGRIRGASLQGVQRFLGIPFAAPPVGALRWKAPRDPQPWTDVRQVTAYGDACPQVGNFYASNDPATFDRPYGDEDCLYLNVWAPAPVAADAGRAGSARPVLLFIHGGSGVYGAASLPVYDGERLARELDAVVVTFNYRLGFFGGIHSTALHDGDPRDDSGNFGLLDQIQALDWVQRNAAAFGGDPGNVTVMGHSAGAISVYALMRSPLAGGKFHRAIVLSGIALNPEPEAAVERTRRLLARLLKHDGMIEDEDQLDAALARLGEGGLRAYLYARSMTELVERSAGIQAMGAVADGTVVEPWRADPKKNFINAVPTLIGSVKDEATLLVVKRATGLGVPQFWALVNSGRSDLRREDFFGNWAYLKYRTLVWLSGRVLAGKLEDSIDLLARTGVPVYRYRFGWDEYPQPWRDLFGVFHGLDVPFIFGNFAQGTPDFTRFVWTDANAQRREAIHRELATALKGFLDHSDPNAYPHAIAWPRWDGAGAVALIR